MTGDEDGIHLDWALNLASDRLCSVGYYFVATGWDEADAPFCCFLSFGCRWTMWRSG